MRKIRYHLVDVFTDRAFGGNPLAVFTNARGLSTDLMQNIAKELNLSETTFVFPPDDPQNDYKVRIFTPAQELPMAGHPTLGTSFVLAHDHLIEYLSPEATVQLEEGVGTIPVTIKFEDGQPTMIQMRQPLPQFGAQFTDMAVIAEMLSLDISDIHPELPAEIVSCGVPFLFVPIKTLKAVQRIQFRAEVWARVQPELKALGVFVFTEEVENSGSHVHCRMFAPNSGIAEDPATGGASGPLGCYIVKRILVSPTSPVELVSEQGIEMGRPSFIQIKIELNNGEINGVYVGGQCYFMGEGYLEING